MRQLTNNYGDCKLVNLEPNTPAGPYVVSQLGHDPEDPRMADQLFILQRDGVWIDQIAHSTLPPEERFHIIFDTLPEVMATLGKLSGKPTIARREVSEAELRQHLAALQAAGSTDALVRSFIASYRAAKVD
jgi:hypothetical protein